MIPTGRTTSEPKHARTQYDALTEQRDYAAHVCPGQHCRGRLTPDRDMRVSDGHRHTDWPVHTLSPEQVAAATTYSGRVR